MGLASLQTRVAPAAAHPAPRHRRRGRRRGRRSRRRQHPATGQRRIRHGRRPGHLRRTSAASSPPTLQSVDAQIAALEHRFGTVQVIENETLHVPGSTQTYELRSQDPHGPYGGPMLQLLSGHYPTGPNEIALTPGLASELNLRVGDAWSSQGDKTVVGIVQNPQSLLDEFALVPPGQVTHPTTIDVLFDAPGVDPGRIGSNVSTPGVAQQQPDQSRHHRAGVGDRRHVADRTGVGRRLHGAGAAPPAGHRDARVHGGNGPQRPARAGGQRRHRRRRGRRGGLRRWVWWPGSSTAHTTSRARITSSPCSPCRGP